ncbi:MAG TPA: DUF480 domain-containing protein [Burkholderiales bacterium]|nr:DUF480 domain-containing protein [Burkholderiales bacterium]
MPQLLSDIEARVIGCLIEKQIATPDQYPLTLNAVVAACNQKSNRQPVMSLSEHDVQAALAALTRRNLVLERFGIGDRVPKYQQLFCNTEFGSLQLSPQQTAIVCELLVRGPQTPGELRSRAARLAGFGAASEVEAALEELMTRSDGPYVARLVREPGRRESRYMQLFSGEAPPAAAESASTPVEPPPGGRASLDERIGALEQAVSDLRAEFTELRALLGRDQ